MPPAAQNSAMDEEDRKEELTEQLVLGASPLDAGVRLLMHLPPRRLHTLADKAHR